MTTPAVGTPRVFLIAQPSVSREGRVPDISDLYRFGDVRVLLDAREFDNVGTSNSGRALEKLLSRLEDYRPDDDYIVWVGGDTAIALMVGAVLYQLGVNSIRWLRYERPRGDDGRRHGDKQYVDYLVPLDGSGGEHDENETPVHDRTH